jgi:hypothetical protein
MATSEVGTLDRRMAIGGAFVGAAGLALPPLQSRTVKQRGMVGGGLVQFEEHEAHFSLFASRLTFARKRKEKEAVVGTVLWVDALAGLTMTSTEVTNYRPLEIPADQGQAREVFGTMRVSGDDAYPFYLLLIDAGHPGSGLDRVNLTVGDGAQTADGAPPVTGLGFSYAAAGPIVTGDVQLIDVDIDTDQ